jgi:hypothetical protein
MLNLLPYALAAYGGYQGYRGAKESGASGIGRLLGTAAGAYTGYSLGTMVPGVQGSGFVPFRQTDFAKQIGMGQKPLPTNLSMDMKGGASYSDQLKVIQDNKSKGNIVDVLFRKSPGGDIDPLKLALSTAGLTYASGAFEQGPTDIYMPGYNMGYLELQRQRGNFKYIDPETGQEKEYQSVYAPEQQGLGDRRIGPYSMDVQRLNTGGLAQIKKFNSGGINYLPSKVSHDENDSNNYVRASGYVEDGSGAGDKDEDTMLAQLADGEFVTRADGVLGAGIIAGGNPNSIKDMREKGAQYFYEQQRRYKRVFDLLKESNGNSKQKEN